MICLTSFSNKFFSLLLALCISTLAGCSGLNVARLQVPKLTPTKVSPQAAQSGEIFWQVDVSGGAAPLTYEFRLLAEHELTVVKRSGEAQWTWQPHNPGAYQISVKVEDAKGVSTVSDWQDYRINPAIKRDSLIAFLPLENLSGVKAPVQQLGADYAEKLKTAGFQLLDEELLKNFMYRHRMRYTGGIGSKIATAFRQEEGVDAVIITSLESYEEGSPPKIALMSRLVLCHDLPKIAWMDGVGISGADNPGLLSLGRIDRMDILQKKALNVLRFSLEDYLSGNRNNHKKQPEEIKPRDYFLASDFNTDAPYKIAVVPFLNVYARRNAGFVAPLHLISILNQHENLDVVEPGLVREQLLKYRLIMQAGPSLAISDVLAHESSLKADLILSGYMFDYQDQSGTPKIDFSTRLFSGPERKIVWWSRSYAAGDDGVYFFDIGRYQSAYTMMEEMSRAIGNLLFPGKTIRQPLPTEFKPSEINQH